MAGTELSGTTGYTLYVPEGTPGVLDSGLAAPSAPSVSNSGTGGTVLAGTYGVEITYVTANGESLPSASSSTTTTGTTSTITTVAPTAPFGATGYNVYMTQAGGSSYTKQTTTAQALGANFVLTAPPTTSGGAVPGTNTATVSWQTLWATARTVTPKPDIIRQAYFAGAQVGEVGIRPGKFQSSGQLSFPFFPNVGIQWWKLLMGKDQLYSAIASDTATITTANGISTVVLTTGSTSWLPYRWMTVNAGANMERRQVLTYNSGSKTATVKAFTNAANQNGSGITVVGNVNHRITQSVQGDPYYGTRPTASVILNRGGLWEWDYAGCFASQMKVAGDAMHALCTLDLTPTVMPQRPGSVTAFAPTTTEYGDQSLFFSIADGYIVTQNDQGNTGASSLFAISDLETWDVTVNNTIVNKTFWDGQQHKAGYPTDMKVTAQYSFVNKAYRNWAFEDFVSSQVLTDTPFVVSMTNNHGTVASPLLYSVGIAIPHLRLIDAAETDTVKDLVTIQVQGEATTPTGGNGIEVWADVALTTTTY